MRSPSNPDDDVVEDELEPVIPPPPKPYDVGYGKPPVSGRFQKGRSGNPSGRPKGKKSLASLMRKYGNKTLRVQMQGRFQTLTYDEVIVAQLQGLALKGNRRASKYWLQWHQAIDERDEPEAAAGGVIRLPTDEFEEFRRLQAEDTDHE